MCRLGTNARTIPLTLMLSLWLCPLTGCIGCADGASVYEVQGTLIDGGSGEPVSNASIDIGLLPKICSRCYESLLSGCGVAAAGGGDSR